MGKGPQDKIYKKLINEYLRFNLSKVKLFDEKLYINTLTGCFNQMGRNHPTCLKMKKELDEKIEKESSNVLQMKEDVQGYSAIVNDYIYNTKHKGFYRGRHLLRRDHFHEIKKYEEKIDI